MPTASEMIVQTLEEAGVEYVFGIPGGGTGQIFQLLYGREDRIKTILVRHEQAAAIMADAYGRATGKAGGGDGARAVHRVERFVRDYGGDVEQLADAGADRYVGRRVGAAAGEPVGGRGVRKHRPAQHLQVHEQVYGAGGQPQGGSAGDADGYQARRQWAAGAVVGGDALGVHRGRGGRGVSAVHPQRRWVPEHREAGKRAVGRAAGGADTVGVAASGAGGWQRGSRGRGPTRSCRNWRSCGGCRLPPHIKERAPSPKRIRCRWGWSGHTARDVANRVVGEADTVIVVGGAAALAGDRAGAARHLRSATAGGWVQIDIDERNAGWSFPVEIGLVGDAGSILNQLVAASKAATEANAVQRREWTASMAPRKDAMSFYDDPEMHRDSSPVTPQRLVSILNETSRPVHGLRAGCGEQPDVDGPPVQGAGSGRRFTAPAERRAWGGPSRRRWR